MVKHRRLYPGCCGKTFWRIFFIDIDRKTGLPDFSDDGAEWSTAETVEILKGNWRQHTCGDIEYKRLSICEGCQVKLGLKW